MILVLELFDLSSFVIDYTNNSNVCQVNLILQLHFAQESLPDGHRAPIAELLQAAHAHKAPSCLHQLTRSVDTQTPSATEQVAPLGSRLPQQQPPLHDVMMAENLSPQQRDSSPAGGVFLGLMDSSLPASPCPPDAEGDLENLWRSL